MAWSTDPTALTMVMMTEPIVRKMAWTWSATCKLSCFFFSFFGYFMRFGCSLLGNLRKIVLRPLCWYFKRKELGVGVLCVTRIGAKWSSTCGRLHDMHNLFMYLYITSLKQKWKSVHLSNILTSPWPWHKKRSLPKAAVTILTRKCATVSSISCRGWYVILIYRHARPSFFGLVCPLMTLPLPEQNYRATYYSVLNE